MAIATGADSYVAGINVSGANGAAGGSPAGITVLRGPNLDVGTISANGGNGTGNSNGGRGGTIYVSTTGAFTTPGALAPSGGSGAGVGAGGPGGLVTVTADDVAVGSVDVTGGTPGASTGGRSGRARLVAFGDLHVQNTVDASGTPAGANAAASDAGAVYLRAGNTLTAGAIAAGGANGGLRGSHGSRIDLLAHDAARNGIITGDGGAGTTAGANANGGHGGAVVARSTGRLDVGALSFRGGSGSGRGAGNGGGGVRDITAADIDVAAWPRRPARAGTAAAPVGTYSSSTRRAI